MVRQEVFECPSGLSILWAKRISNDFLQLLRMGSKYPRNDDSLVKIDPD